MVRFWSKKLQRFWSICAALIFELRPFRINPSEIYGGNILGACQLFSLLPQTHSERSNRVFCGAKKKIQIRNYVVWETEKWLTELSDGRFTSSQFRPIGKHDLGLDTSVDTVYEFLRWLRGHACGFHDPDRMSFDLWHRAVSRSRFPSNDRTQKSESVSELRRDWKTIVILSVWRLPARVCRKKSLSLVFCLCDTSLVKPILGVDPELNYGMQILSKFLFFKQFYTVHPLENYHASVASWFPKP